MRGGGARHLRRKKLVLEMMAPINNHTHCVVPQPIAPSGVAAGTFFLAASILAPLPQLLKILRRQSSAGLSLFTLMLCLGYMTLNVAASVLTKWSTLVDCATNAAACWQLLDVMQQVAADVAYVALMIASTAYEPYRSRRCPACGACCVLTALLVAACIYSSRAPCTIGARTVADVCAAAAGLLVVVAFAPQLVETWRCRGKGSMSYLFFSIQAVGCFLIAAVDASAFRDPWTAYGPFVASGCTQAAVVLLGAYFAWRDGELGDEGASSNIVPACAPASAAPLLRT